MSGTHLRLIPTDPTFIPAPDAQRKAVALLAEALPHAHELYAEQTPGVQFIDQGSNFKSVACPLCGTVLDTAWWQRAMDRAWGGKAFVDLLADLPCCGGRVSLNDLMYDMPAGFARFMIDLYEPEGDVGPEAYAELERSLGCKLRKIWARY
jgi:hypothetical protein